MTVRFTPVLAKKTGRQEIAFNIADGTRLGVLLTLVRDECQGVLDGLLPTENGIPTAMLLHNDYATLDPNEPLSDGDTVTIGVPLGGG